MRIASVLHDASIDKDGAPLLATVALERDGAVYSVEALAKALGSRCANVAEDLDFQHAVIALRGESLRELDERVRSGGAAVFRALAAGHVHVAAAVRHGAGGAAALRPRSRGCIGARAFSFRAGSARALLGHEATVPVLAGEHDVAIGFAVAAVLGDDLFRATEREAHDAILGYTLLLSFEDGLAAQLGPSLVTRDECGPIAKLRAQIRLDGQAIAVCEVGDRPFAASETIAWISHHAPLRAGDVIAASPIDDRDLRRRIAYGTRVELAVERLGRVAGTPTRGPEMRAWRR